MRPPAGPPPERFEYTGPTRLIVRGPGSGRTYLFDGPGARVAVDPRDAAALFGVPGLRPVTEG
ncbi:MAG TPA: hypothetical protein VHM02_00225 [Thermoanaerobaculia bacterium]|nr:hypothetical protein [Thermoanaerobaculia bacterium]